MSNEIYPISKLNINVMNEDKCLYDQVKISYQKEIRNMKYFGVMNGMTILDIGCGSGWFSRILCESFPDSIIYAVDGNKDLLSLCKKHHQTYINKGQLKVIYGEIGKLDFVIEIHVIVSRLVLQHLSLPLRDIFLQEMYQLLTPNGLCFITTTDKTCVSYTTIYGKYINHVFTKYYEFLNHKDDDVDFLTHLPSQLNDKGFTFLNVDNITVHSDEP